MQVAFERENDLGGFWRYSPDPKRPSVYKSTHIDTGRDLNSYGDRPFMPEDDMCVLIFDFHKDVLVSVRCDFREIFSMYQECFFLHRFGPFQ